MSVGIGVNVDVGFGVSVTIGVSVGVLGKAKIDGEKNVDDTYELTGRLKINKFQDMKNRNGKSSGEKLAFFEIILDTVAPFSHIN